MKSSQRIEVIDVLRGFALLGILVVHASGEFAGWSGSYNSPYSAAQLPTASLDSGFNFIVNLLFTNKSRALFAFLFGVGFYFQLGKASRSGHRIEAKFAKRMGFLFLIGALHAYMIWAGDILRIYAVCGLLLLPVYKWKPKTLLIIACVCTILVPAIASAIHLYFPSSVLSSFEKQTMYQDYASDGYGNLFHANLLRDASVMLDPYSIGIYLVPVWGNFLFGFWAAQSGLVQHLASRKTRLLSCLFISGITGFICSNNFVRVMATLLNTKENNIATAWRSVLSIPAFYSIEAVGFFLLCCIIYLYEFTPVNKLLLFFTYAGRMTLTNYMMQSLFAVLFFFGAGLGFISHFGASIAFCIGIIFFVFQLAFSYIWLQYFTTGPVEYVWRSMIEGKWQIIRKRKMSVAPYS